MEEFHRVGIPRVTVDVVTVLPLFLFRQSTPARVRSSNQRPGSLEGLHLRDVDQLKIIANLDADSVAHLGDDFIWALVLWVERRFD